MEISNLPIDQVIPYARNPRQNDGAVAKVAASIQEFGFRQPIVVDGDRVVIAGHTRLLAARQLGLTEVPTHVATGLSPAQVKAYRLADNRVAEESSWDTDLLALELDDLDGEIDFGVLGFNDDELERYRATGTDGLTDEDDVPDPPAEPVTVLGDVWLLGKHRLVCGDSTDADVVASCLNGVEPHLMVTDPPYGVEYDPNWRNEADRANGRPIGAMATGIVMNDDNADWREVWALFPGDVAYIWHAGNKAHIVADSLLACDFNIRAQIIWAKNNIVIGRGDYHPKHEPCWYAVKKNKVGHWGGSRKESTVWNIDKPMKSETGHGTQKPAECMRRPIENNSSPGQAIYEPFNGSGTTIIAAETTGRSCHAIELSPTYVDVAIKRWQEFTGIDATMESTGQTFNEVSDARTTANTDSTQANTG